jgi:Methyltransferase domain
MSPAAPRMLRDLFDTSELRSAKPDTYFEVYERVLGRFAGRGATIVEVGVGDGGSILMWKKYFRDARIIGVDINPNARDLSRFGIEIHIGDQGSDAFWETFYADVGPIDVLLDDGGHHQEQQIVTVAHALRNLRDGGVAFVEDVNTSYLPEFGGLSPYSFVNFAKHLVDCVNSRAGDNPGKGEFRDVAWSLEFFESIVVIHVDRGRSREPILVENRGAAGISLPGAAQVARKPLRFLKRIPVLGSIATACLRAWRAILRTRRLARYFR